MIKILLADDHSLMRQGTRRSLEQCPDFEVVGEADNGEQALEMIKSLKPDIALLDVRMPRMNGIEVVRQMRACCPGTKALMLTAYDDDDYILALMEAGASGYLLKTVQTAELVNSIRNVDSGEPVLDPAIAVKVARLWAHGAVSARNSPVEQLSPRELSVLELAARGLRNKGIAQKLKLSIRTVEGHFNGIYAKFGVSGRTEAVLYAVSRGLVKLEQPAP